MNSWNGYLKRHIQSAAASARPNVSEEIETRTISLSRNVSWNIDTSFGDPWANIQQKVNGWMWQNCFILSLGAKEFHSWRLKQKTNRLGYYCNTSVGRWMDESLNNLSKQLKHSLKCKKEGLHCVNDDHFQIPCEWCDDWLRMKVSKNDGRCTCWK